MATGDDSPNVCEALFVEYDVCDEFDEETSFRSDNEESMDVDTALVKSPEAMSEDEKRAKGDFLSTPTRSEGFKCDDDDDGDGHDDDDDDVDGNLESHPCHTVTRVERTPSKSDTDLDFDESSDELNSASISSTYSSSRTSLDFKDSISRSSSVTDLKCIFPGSDDSIGSQSSDFEENSTICADKTVDGETEDVVPKSESSDVQIIASQCETTDQLYSSSKDCTTSEGLQDNKSSDVHVQASQKKEKSSLEAGSSSRKQSSSKDHRRRDERYNRKRSPHKSVITTKEESRKSDKKASFRRQERDSKSESDSHRREQSSSARHRTKTEQSERKGRSDSRHTRVHPERNRQSDARHAQKHPDKKENRSSVHSTRVHSDSRERRRIKDRDSRDSSRRRPADKLSSDRRARSRHREEKDKSRPSSRPVRRTLSQGRYSEKMDRKKGDSERKDNKGRSGSGDRAAGSHDRKKVSVSRRLKSLDESRRKERQEDHKPTRDSQRHEEPLSRLSKETKSSQSLRDSCDVKKSDQKDSKRPELKKSTSRFDKSSSSTSFASASTSAKCDKTSILATVSSSKKSSTSDKKKSDSKSSRSVKDHKVSTSSSQRMPPSSGGRSKRGKSARDMPGGEGMLIKKEPPEETNSEYKAKDQKPCIEVRPPYPSDSAHAVIDYVFQNKCLESSESRSIDTVCCCKMLLGYLHGSVELNHNSDQYLKMLQAMSTRLKHIYGRKDIEIQVRRYRHECVSRLLHLFQMPHLGGLSNSRDLSKLCQKRLLSLFDDIMPDPSLKHEPEDEVSTSGPVATVKDVAATSAVPQKSTVVKGESKTDAAKPDVKASSKPKKPPARTTVLGVGLIDADPKKKLKRGNKLRNVITRMQDIEGPISVLYTALQERLIVKVWTRGARQLRGYCLGYIVAFDKFWNLAMVDVDEVYIKTCRKKDCTSSNFDEPDLPKLSDLTMGERATGSSKTEESCTAKKDDITGDDVQKLSLQLQKLPSQLAALSEDEIPRKSSNSRSRGKGPQEGVRKKPASCESQDDEQMHFRRDRNYNVSHDSSGPTKTYSRHKMRNSATGSVIPNYCHGGGALKRLMLPNRWGKVVERHINQLFIRGDSIVSVGILEFH